MLLLLACCIVVPAVELVVFVEVADRIGVGEALLALLGISLLGAWLVKAQGLAVLRQGRADLQRGAVPGRAIVDGLLVLVAGGLLLVPGFVTAIAGLLLLIPLTRGPVREYLIRRWTRGRTVRWTRRSGRVGPDGARVERIVITSRDAGSEAEQLGGQRALESGDEPLG